MSKSFICFLGTAVMCLTLGVILQVTGNPRFSTIAYTSGAVSGVLAILLLANPIFFRNLHKIAFAWLASIAGFGILAYYLKGLGAEYQTMTLTCAGISALSAISAISHGIYPTSERASSLIALALDPILFVVITWIALSGLNTPIEMFKAPIADQMANLPRQEFGVIDTSIAMIISLFKGKTIEINGVMPFPQFFLLLHIIWNFFKVMRSYSWWFIGSCIAIPFIFVAWVSHVPRTLGLATYVMGAISLIVIATFSINLWKHWNNPATS